MEKLNRAQKCSILGPQNLGSRGGPGPRGPPGSAPATYVAQTKNEQKKQNKTKNNRFASNAPRIIQIQSNSETNSNNSHKLKIQTNLIW